MKTIGVLGGIGPQATMDFEARLHREAQRRIPPFANTGYPPMVVVYLRQPPVLLGEDLKPRLPLVPDPGLLDGARLLGTVADFLVIASNFPHVIQPEIEQAAGRPLLSMIDVTLEAVRARGWTRVGVVGMGLPTVYTSRLRPLGIEPEALGEDERADLDRSILALMEGRDNEATCRVAHRAMTTLRARGVDGTILGCTEIPLMLGPAAEAPDLLNPAQLLAEAALARAMA